MVILSKDSEWVLSSVLLQALISLSFTMPGPSLSLAEGPPVLLRCHCAQLHSYPGQMAVLTPMSKHYLLSLLQFLQSSSWSHCSLHWSVEPSLPHSTILDHSRSWSILYVLDDPNTNKHIAVKLRPPLWCTVCLSGLAVAELIVWVTLASYVSALHSMTFKLLASIPHFGICWTLG